MSDNCPAFVTYFGQDHICLHQRNKDEMIVSMVCNTNQGYAKGKRCRGQVGYVRSRAIDLSCRQSHIKQNFDEFSTTAAMPCLRTATL